MTAAEENFVAAERMKQLLAFIEQDVKEKIKQIESKVEEEFSEEKERLIKDAQTKINAHFAKLEKQVERNRKILCSHIKNQARIDILNGMNDHIRSVLDSCKQRVAVFSKQNKKYVEFTCKILLQGFYSLLENDVTIVCRNSDRQFLQQAIDRYCVPEYKKKTGKDIRVSIDTKTSLADNSCGGVILKTAKIQVVCTLEARLEHSFAKSYPVIRVLLFGKNPRRKHYD